MQGAFDAALARASRAILVGSDIPALSAQYLRDAERALAGGDDVVIGPAQDGGYVLVGLSRCDPELFRGIPWEVRKRWRRPADAIAGLSWRSSELPVLVGRDRPEDLGALAEDMRQSSMPAAGGSGDRNGSVHLEIAAVYREYLVIPVFSAISTSVASAKSMSLVAREQLIELRHIFNRKASRRNPRDGRK